jgi:hypothetical protein
VILTGTIASGHALHDFTFAGNMHYTVVSITIDNTLGIATPFWLAMTV